MEYFWIAILIIAITLGFIFGANYCTATIVIAVAYRSEFWQNKDD